MYVCKCMYTGMQCFYHMNSYQETAICTCLFTTSWYIASQWDSNYCMDFVRCTCVCSSMQSHTQLPCYDNVNLLIYLQLVYSYVLSIYVSTHIFITFSFNEYV